MSASNGTAQAAGMKEFLQELRGNRKTQGMAVLFLLVVLWMVWMFWPEQKKARPRPGSGATAASSVLGEQQLKSLEKLPDLAKAAGAGELPKDSDMARDLFLFDLPQKKVVQVQIEVTPPPPPTPEEIAAAAEKAARDKELGTKPSGARYLGFLTTKRQGRVGAFIKAEEALTLPIGDLSFTGWKLVKLDETGAEFQNLRFPDLRHKIQPSDSTAAGAQTNVRNDF